MCSSSKINVTLQALWCLEILVFFLFLCYFFSRLSILYYFNLSSYSKSCPLIHLSFTGSWLAGFPFHLFLKAKCCSNKYTDTHFPISGIQDQSSHQNPFLTPVVIIIGLSLLLSSSVVNTFLLYLDSFFSHFPQLPSMVTDGSLSCSNIHK